MNPKQLTFVREYRGYSQTELASYIPGLSQSNLSKYEKGIGTLSEEVKQKIINFLGFPAGFYELEISNNVENAHYRKKAGLNKKQKDYIDKSNKLIGYIIDQMSDSIEFPNFTIKPIDLSEGFTPKSVAQHIRRLLGVRQGPVKNICDIFESNGIIIVKQNNFDEGFDGVSFLTDKGIPVVIINGNYSNDRERLTLAHELGHIVMHLFPEIAIPDYRNSEKEREKEAFEFAAEFLMPENEILESLRNLRLASLMILKQYWLTSMASIVKRAQELKCIDDEKYKYLNVELSRHGYKKNEPGNVYIDKPQIFKDACMLFKTELGYSDDELAETFLLPTDVIRNLCSKQTSHLRILKNRL